MLKTDLIDLVNGGGMWAFIGTGPSIDSGLSSWENLTHKIISKYSRDIQDKILSDLSFKKSLEHKIFIDCFSVIEHYGSREIIENGIKELLTVKTPPGELIKNICDWPFAGYITTNYDNLIEVALTNAGQHGWATIGNASTEIRKISGDVKNVIWHIHGAVNLPKGSSRYILTKNDYSWFYSDNNPALDQLRALLLQRRIIFIGFGFNDEEVKKQLRFIGQKYINPARPAYAFLADLTGQENEFECTDLRQSYNIDVIPYRTENGAHHRLTNLIKTYGTMILRNTLKFGQPVRSCPSYDPETTGLLIYNNLCLKEPAVHNDILRLLLKSRILSLLQHEKVRTLEDLTKDLFARIQAVGGKSQSKEEVLSKINDALQELRTMKLIQNDIEQNLVLTKDGQKLAEDQAAQSKLMEDQFANSIISRVFTVLKQENDSERIGKIVAAFLLECIDQRSLGVALAMFSPQASYQEYHMVALLQKLPDFLSQLKNESEAQVLINVIQQLLSDPNYIEKTYVGLLLQAKFGVHLLGYDDATLKARTKDFSNTVFLIDSSTLIPFLAISSAEYDTARLLINRIQSLNSYVATTTKLALEVAEHARWAYEKLKSDRGKLGVATLKSFTGPVKRENAFLEGFIEMLAKGSIVSDFSIYMGKILGTTKGDYVKDKDIETLLQKESILCCDFNNWEGFDQGLYYERDETSKKISEERKKWLSYKHERQVDAEAEALLIIKNLRNGNFKVNGNITPSAFFISNTRVIDNVANVPGMPFTMRPESVLQWITTLQPCKLEEMGILTNSLLGELSQAGFNIIKYERLRIVFGPLLDASKEKLDEELMHHRSLISDRFGEDGIKAFREIAPLDVPIVQQGLATQINVDTLKELENVKKDKDEAEARTKISEKDQKAFYRWKDKKEMRKRKQSSPKKKTKKKKRKKS